MQSWWKDYYFGSQFQIGQYHNTEFSSDTSVLK